MAEKHPYLSGNAGLVQAVNQLRKSFPSQVSADTLKNLAIAPKNESLVMNILRFIGLVDADGKKAAIANKVFSAGDSEFQTQFGKEDTVLFYAQVIEAQGKTSEARSIESRRARCHSLEHQW